MSSLRNALLLCCAVVLAGCVRLALPEEDLRPTPTRPVWIEEEIREHLRYFNSILAGRASGTQGYAQAAAYVAARMAQYELQPALDGQYRVLYYNPLNFVRSAIVATTGADSVLFSPGFDYIADARSDSGTVRFSRILVARDQQFSEGSDVTEDLSGEVVLVPSPDVQTSYLRALRARGVRAVLHVGELKPGQSEFVIEGLLIVQITRNTAAEILNADPFVLAGSSTDELFVRVQLPGGVLVRVASTFQGQAGMINTLGFVAGKNPARSGELVIVCTDLDAVGQFMGVRRFDDEDLGLSAAALLELSRNYSYLGQLSSVPERTILFAVWSGSRVDHAGLRAYLRNPLWALEDTHAMVYIGLSEDKRPAVQKILDASGIPLHAIPPPPDMMPAQVVVSDPNAPVSARSRKDTGERVSLSDILEDAIVNVTSLARETHETLFPLAITPAPMKMIPDNSATPSFETSR